ncbi:hemagglutinin repeat-containing protein, partial [Methylomusa anaerophila]
HGTENGNTTTHTGSVIDASDTVTLRSGNDTNIYFQITIKPNDGQNFRHRFTRLEIAFAIY